MSQHARNALLRRFATDLHVVLAAEESQRPADMPCCWLQFEKPSAVPGRPVPACTTITVTS